MKNIALMLLAVSNVFASTSSPLIVYGKDDRHDTITTNTFYQKLAKSTAGMYKKSSINDLGSHVMFNPATLGEERKLIKGSRFADQSSPLICSGFLVGKDLLVTAGHCIENMNDCNSSSFIFDYKVDEVGKNAKLLVSKTNVYNCSEIIENKLDMSATGDVNQDYALIRLDRAVTNREPLKFRKTGRITTTATVMTIGHPSGLPQKITFNGKIFENDHNNYFLTNLDTFGGNSGSPVFDQKTGLVEGILVRGAKDYLTFPNFSAVNYVAEDITGKLNLGESVTRITDIQYLVNSKAKQAYKLNQAKKSLSGVASNAVSIFK